MNKHSDIEYITDIVRKYSDMIIRIAFGYTRNSFDAEDIAQSVFLSLLNAQDFHEEKHLKSWLIRVTINKAKDLIKSASRKRTLSLEAAKNCFAPEPNQVQVELDKLDEKDRTILYLFYFEGYKAKEIGNMLKLKEKAVLMRLNRARAKLKNLLEETNS